MKAMILASGRGERMMPITKDIPKPMLKIGNVTLLEDKIIRLAESGITEIIINIGYLGYQIKDHVGDGSKYGIEIIIIIVKRKNLKKNLPIFIYFFHLFYKEPTLKIRLYHRPEHSRDLYFLNYFLDL